MTLTEFYALEPLPSLAALPCSVLAVSTEHISNQQQAQATPRSKVGLKMLSIMLVSDPVGDVAKKYGVYKDEENVCFNSVFLLDPEGRVVSVKKRDMICPSTCDGRAVAGRLQPANVDDVDGQATGGWMGRGRGRGGRGRWILLCQLLNTSLRLYHVAELAG